MIQEEFANRAKSILEKDDNVIGLAVAGSWLTNEMDKFSDLDLILITQQKVSGNKNKVSLLKSLLNAVSLYRQSRKELFSTVVIQQSNTAIKTVANY